MSFTDPDISRAIARRYHAKLERAIEGDVVLAGAGPSNLVAARKLAEAGLSVTVVEKRLALGGGIWGGAMLMNEVIVQADAVRLLAEAQVTVADLGRGLYAADASEMACGLGRAAIAAGAVVLNTLEVEDIRVTDGRVTGVVVKRLDRGTPKLYVDPLVFSARATVDGTGHDAELVGLAEQHGLRLCTRTGARVGQGPMDAPAGERFVVEHTGPVCPGLYVAGMAVCATFGGPRMGPIFGGMLLSGEKVARLVSEELK